MVLIAILTTCLSNTADNIHPFADVDPTSALTREDIEEIKERSRNQPILMESFGSMSDPPTTRAYSLVRLGDGYMIMENVTVNGQLQHGGPTTDAYLGPDLLEPRTYSNQESGCRSQGKLTPACQAEARRFVSETLTILHSSFKRRSP